MRSPFGDGDVVGVGSGRGVAYTVNALMTHHLPFRARRVTVASLNGSLNGPDWKYWFDSDVQAERLGNAR
jgi:DNA-binding transcriptional regulator LsrR (DeoR family)